MKEFTANISILLKKFISILLLYEICRLLFYLFNHSNFSDVGVLKLLLMMIYGVRFDASVIILSNSIFIILFLLPFPFRENKFYRIVLRWLFVVVNSLAMLANCVDLVYFQFTYKRLTADVFNFFKGNMGNDFWRLLPLFLKDYWYMFLIWLFLTYEVILVFRRTEKNIFIKWNAKKYLSESIVFIVGLAFSILIYRGGIQLKPISAITAAEYVDSKNIPLVTNSAFTILKTLDLQAISNVIYYSNESELKKIYNPYHKGSAVGFKKMNVFIIILESFSKEYCGSLNNHKNKGYTPFLDSLMTKSFVCTNAIANSKRSIEGIPAIIAGIPTWMEEPYLTSNYGTNKLNSIAGLLKQQGYYTAFFHAAENGSMGFEEFSHLAGYQDYYGKNEYNNPKDDDGNWGIWDEEFLQFTANKINEKPQPFVSTVFTLTSHHPFKIPKRYKSKFKEGELEIEKTISYTDYALQRFFESAKKMNWFQNTLFVICADHTGVSEDGYFTNRIGNFSIPIVYYQTNSSLKKMDTVLTQQIDILPSVLDYLHYPKSYFAFGNSVFDSTSNRFALNTNNGVFQLLNQNYSMQFDGEKANDLYHYKNDSLLKIDLLKNANELEMAKSMEYKVKAVLQTYRQSLIKNKMTGDK